MVSVGPTFTREYRAGDLDLPDGAIYIHGQVAPDERSIVDEDWAAKQRSAGVRFVAVVSEGREEFTVRGEDGALVTLMLFDKDRLARWIGSLGDLVYLDLTAIALRTWAPVLRIALDLDIRLRFVYVEPLTYRRTDRTSEPYELSEVTEGISAVPGFARISSTSNDAVPLIPLLGFEGNRLRRLLSRLESPAKATYPILGVPGFQIEFPFYSLEGNRLELAREFMHRQIVLARANCPFDAFHELASIADRLGAPLVQVAPLGTKPHALGATLFAISRGSKVDLVYDHPIRARRPTMGVSRVCVYYVSEFAASQLDIDTPRAAA